MVIEAQLVHQREPALGQFGGDDLDSFVEHAV